MQETSAREHAVWLYLPESHKNSWRNKKLIKAIPKIAQTALEPYLDRDETQHCFSPREALEAIGRTQGERKSKRIGTKYTTSSYRRGIVYGFEKAEKAGSPITRWTPNQLRHLAATELDGLLGREAAQKWLGHSTIDTTAIYAERQEAELLKLAEQLNQHWGESLPEADG